MQIHRILSYCLLIDMRIFQNLSHNCQNFKILPEFQFKVQCKLSCLKFNVSSNYKPKIAYFSLYRSTTEPPWQSGEKVWITKTSITWSFLIQMSWFFGCVLLRDWTSYQIHQKDIIFSVTEKIFVFVILSLRNKNIGKS